MAYIKCRKTTSVEKREEIIALWSSGAVRQEEIPERVGLSRKTVTNVVNKFLQHGSLFPGKPGWKERTVSTPDVVEFVEYSKIKKKPSIQTSEIRQSLVDEGICNVANLPSRSTIGDILRNDLDFTFKKISVCPEESLTNENLMKTQDYIMYISGVDPSTIHV